MSARERIGHLVLEICPRLRITNSAMGASFRLPLTEGQITEPGGLTNVYVSTRHSRLRDEWLVSMCDGSVTI